MKKALIVYGGWDGHEPKLVSERFAGMLEKNGFVVDKSDSLSAFEDLEKLKTYDLLIPIWTMDKISKEAAEAVSQAVISGVGLAGCHGGMCDAFRDHVGWQFMTGGQWVSHPGADGVKYTVNICNHEHPITAGIEDFTVSSEHYYMHVDPANKVLATTEFPVVDGPHVPNGKVQMPVVWTKYWGKGHVFYTSLGHHADVFDVSEVALLMERGMLWAAEKEETV